MFSAIEVMFGCEINIVRTNLTDYIIFQAGDFLGGTE